MADTNKIEYVSLSKLGYYDGKIKGYVDAADNALKSNLEGQLGVVAGALDGEIERAKAAEGVNAAAIEGLQGEIDSLETLVGTLPTGTEATDIVGYVNAKTAGIATDAALGELQGQLNGVQGEVAAIKGDYLKAEDKTELSDAINAEKSRAEGIEGGLRTDIDAIKGDYLKNADKTTLQGGIDAAQAAADAVQAEMTAFKLAAEVGDKAVDTLKEIQDYITTDGEAAAKMTDDIAANADEIETAKGRLSTAEGKITTIEGQITGINGDITSLQGEDTAIKGRLDVIDGKLGANGDVANAIATAKQEAIDDAASKDDALEIAIKKYVDDADDVIEGTIATLEGVVNGKVSQSDHDTLANRVETAEGAIGTINTNLAGKAAQGDLDAATGRISALETWHADFVECTKEDIDKLFQA